MSDSISLAVGVSEQVLGLLVFFKFVNDPQYDKLVWKYGFTGLVLGIVHATVLYVLLIKRRQDFLHHR